MICRWPKSCFCAFSVHLHCDEVVDLWNALLGVFEHSIVEAEIVILMVTGCAFYREVAERVIESGSWYHPPLLVWVASANEIRFVLLQRRVGEVVIETEI